VVSKFAVCGDIIELSLSPPAVKGLFWLHAELQMFGGPPLFHKETLPGLPWFHEGNVLVPYSIVRFGSVGR